MPDFIFFLQTGSFKYCWNLACLSRADAQAVKVALCTTFFLTSDSTSFSDWTPGQALKLNQTRWTERRGPPHRRVAQSLLGYRSCLSSISFVISDHQYKSHSVVNFTFAESVYSLRRVERRQPGPPVGIKKVQHVSDVTRRLPNLLHPYVPNLGSV